MRREVALAMAVVVVALAWAGCGSDGSTTTGIHHPALVPASAALIHTVIVFWERNGVGYTVSLHDHGATWVFH